MTGLLDAGYFLFSILFLLLIYALWLRIMLRYNYVTKEHPICQAINTVTNAVVKPFSLLFTKKILLQSRYDWPGYIGLIVVEFVKFLIFGALFLTKMLPLIWLIIYVVADLIVQPFNLLFYAIIVRVILSWVNQEYESLFAKTIVIITEPLLRFGRSCIPPISGFDFSPLFVLIVLKFVVLFIASSLPLNLI